MIECATISEAEPVEFNGEHDRVRLLAHYPPKVTLSTLVNSLKGASARLLRKELLGPRRTCLWGEHFWSRPTSSPPVAGAPVAIVKEYIESRKCPDGPPGSNPNLGSDSSRA
ncbi:hypothetical protein GCM10009555_104200 [Acrocarpospora macrocephala]|uniref:Transposase IS200-like domain-containing protein n=2 Tax=Acrocarpospora macrocephala TaxID=150177 RepID=A0A5M3X718_9ACTN|nr:hypothetical protein Amac_104920 [Acrocarpospora macrocephala]